MTGAPEVVLVRGQVIVENDELVAEPGAGQFVKRARFGEELTPTDGRRRPDVGRGGKRGLRAARGSARASRSAARPCVLVIDFSCGFTDPACALGSDLTPQVEATRRLLDAAREKGLPVVFTTIGFDASLKDGGLWLQKVPTLGELQLGGTGWRSTRASAAGKTRR